PVRLPGLGILANFRRGFGLLLERRGQVLRGAACMPISALLVLWMAQLLGEIVDSIRAAGGAGDAAASLGSSCLLLAGLAAGDAVLRFFGRHQLINASRHMEARLKSDLQAHIGRLPIAWFDRARTGDLLSRLTQDVELIRFVTGPTLLYGLSAIVVVPGGVWLMLQFSPLVALAAGVSLAVLLLGIAGLMPGLQRNSKAVQESIADISQRASESFHGIRVLLAFARGDRATERIRELSEHYVDCNVRLATIRAWFNVLVHGCREIVILSVVVLGAVEVGRGNLTIGQLLSFFALLGAMVWPLIAIGWIVSSWHRAVSAAERIEEIFAIEPEPSTGERRELHGEIEVRGLTFTYPGSEQPSLRDVSFRIRPGQRVGVVGPIGSGKSTLLAILLRFYDPPRGSVFVDGVDVLDLHPASLRELFALAPQDPFLFSDTLVGNLRFGRADATDDEVGRLTEFASLERDLEALPDGQNTLVGERGVTLSGGQKQRVSLARALATDRRALILDDTLSAVDHATERRILESLKRARGGRTLIAVAHRLSIVEHSDLILVLERGRLTAQGTHGELIARPGYYADTWRRQREERELERGWGNR
ncbi:MAG: ABC transporter ATP-binding protein, partial [Planctomycetes bacterium]|nr:ABC transporter ATP-binding protein [Planctomycetota bacterium]